MVLLQAHLSGGRGGVCQWGARAGQPVPHMCREVWEWDGAGRRGKVVDGGGGGGSRVGGQGSGGPVCV